MAKKVLSIALVLMMMLSLSVTAFAASDADIEELVLEKAYTDFVANGLTEDQASAATVSSTVANGDSTYTVVVKSGLLYSITYTVTEVEGWGILTVSDGDFVAEDSFLMLILNAIYEFFADFFSMFTGFFA